MAIQVTVGPPQITINRGNTFVLSEPDGSVTAYTDQGFYRRDTRYVSNYEFYADGERWELQNSGATAHYASRAYLMNPLIRTEYGDIQRSTLSLMFTRAVNDGIVEDFEIRNYGTARARFNFEIALRTDFADIFEVKSQQIIRKGHVTTCWDLDSRQLVSRYEHDGFSRALISRFDESKYVPIYTNGRISFGVDLEPGGVANPGRAALSGRHRRTRPASVTGRVEEGAAPVSAGAARAAECSTPRGKRSQPVADVPARC